MPPIHLEAPKIGPTVDFAVDPVPVQVETLEGMARSAPVDSPERALASRRVAALIPLTRPAGGHPPAERALHGADLTQEDPLRRGDAVLEMAHAYERARDFDRAKQAYLVFLCPSTYAYPQTLDKSGAETLFEKPQDHDERFWNGWEVSHPKPLDQARLNAKTAARPSDTASRELVYRTIFGPGCPDPLESDARTERARQRARAWFELGMLLVFDPSTEAGPYRHHRALEAFEHAVLWSRTAAEDELVLASELWTASVHFTMQRYDAAARASLTVLGALERLSSPAMRAALERHAGYLVASGVTYVDFKGPPRDDPFIVRNDTLEMEPNPLIAEEKLRIGLTRLQDPAFVSQKAIFLDVLYLELMDEYSSLSLGNNVIVTAEAFLSRFPTHSNAPIVHERIAETASQWSRLSPDASPARAAYANRARSARRDISVKYIAGSPWANANSKNAAALAGAAAVVARTKKGLGPGNATTP